MQFINRYYWPLVGASLAVVVLALLLRAGQPAAGAGLVLGGLLMLRAAQQTPRDADADVDVD